MKIFYKKAVLFWFVLLIIAFINAIIRETTYMPLLIPFIGGFAYQISSLTSVILFYIAIHFFLKKSKQPYNQKDIVNVGLLWIIMTIIFESFMNLFIRKLTFQQVLETYYFWNGDTWVFVLLSLLVSPLIIYKKFKSNIRV